MKIEGKIRKQMANNDNSRNYEARIALAKLMLNLSIAVQVFLSLFAGGGMTFIIAMIQSLQIIIHFPIFNIRFPASIMTFYEILLPFVMFDILQSFETSEKMFTNFFHPEDEKLDTIEIDDQIISLGYETHNPILNLGTVGLFLIFYVFQLILMALVVTPCKLGKVKLCKRFHKYLMRKLFFKEILMIFVQTSIEIMMSGFLSLQVPDLPKVNQDNNPTMHGIAFSFIIISVGVIPILFIWMLSRPTKYYFSKNFFYKFGILVNGINIRYKAKVAYFFLFQMRRILYIQSYFLFQEHPIFQILILNYTNIVILIYQGHNRPYILQIKNKIELLNEVFTFNLTFFVFCYTKWISDLELQSKIGDFNAGIIGIMILVNMCFVVMYSLK